MIHSMTAYARREAQTEWGTLVWELRSLNHRYLEINLRLPEELRQLEGAARARIGAAFRRGKLDAGLRFEPEAAAQAEPQLNQARARQMVAMAEQVRAMMDAPAPLDALAVLQWPGVLEPPGVDLERLQETALELLADALNELEQGRAREGAQLKALIQQRLGGVRTVVTGARNRLPQVVQQQRERLRNRLAEVMEELDEGRVEQEIALLAQKLDVAEELDRLESHVDEVRRVLERNEPVGRRLDFLMQELNREANTLGAKSGDTQMTRASVELKVLIEQMREQVQNIE